MDRIFVFVALIGFMLAALGGLALYQDDGTRAFLLVGAGFTITIVSAAVLSRHIK